MYMVILLINYVFNFFVLWMLTQYFQLFWAEKTVEEIALIIFTGMFFLFAFGTTPLGERLVAFSVKCRKLGGKERKAVDGAFKEVCRRAGVDPKAYRLVLLKDDSINAKALGKRTVAVTTGLLKMDDDEIKKALLAHELGHLVNNDAVVKTAVLITGVFYGAVFRVVTLNYSLLNLWEKCSREGEGVIQLAAMAVAPPVLLYKTLNHVQETGFSLVSQIEELLADRFAAEIGYREGLVKFLKILWKEEQKRNIRPVIFDSHPPTEVRLIALGDKTDSTFYRIAREAGWI